MSVICNMKLVSHDKSVDLARVSCHITLFECLWHNDLNLRQVSIIWCHKPGVLLFRTIARIGNLLRKHTLGTL